MKLPAEQEDWLKRPGYIHENDAGVSICENRYSVVSQSRQTDAVMSLVGGCEPDTRCLFRLQYLVAKGAIMRKGCVVWFCYSKCCRMV